MVHPKFKLAVLAIFALLTAQIVQAANPVGPSTVSKNQFGETSINVITGGSNQIDCNFIVDSTNGNGLGIRSLKGAGCAHVYMHTSSTAAAGSPNPAAGYIQVELSTNYSGYIGGYSGFVQPLSTASPLPVTSATPYPLTYGDPYVVTTVGTTPTSMWQSIGLALGLTPTVGQAFIATNPSPLPLPTGSGAVEPPASTGTGIGHIEIIGDANQTVSATQGATIIMAVMGDQIPTALPSPAPTPALLGVVTPANNSVIGLRFVMLPLPSQLK